MGPEWSPKSAETSNFRAWDDFLFYAPRFAAYLCRPVRGTVPGAAKEQVLHEKHLRWCGETADFTHGNGGACVPLRVAVFRNGRALLCRLRQAGRIGPSRRRCYSDCGPGEAAAGVSVTRSRCPGRHSK